MATLRIQEGENKWDKNSISLETIRWECTRADPRWLYKNRTLWQNFGRFQQKIDSLSRKFQSHARRVVLKVVIKFEVLVYCDITHIILWLTQILLLLLSLFKALLYNSLPSPVFFLQRFLSLFREFFGLFSIKVIEGF